MNDGSQKSSTGDGMALIGRRRLRKRLVMLAILVLGGVGAPIAYAFWSSSGTGVGAASAGTLQPVVIQTVGFGTHLRPSGPMADVTMHLSNPNDYAVVFDGVSAGTVHSNKLGCDGDDTGVAMDLSSLTGTIPSGISTFVAKATMSNASASACQGATFSAAFTLAVRK
jgi:hypothetical protein